MEITAAVSGCLKYAADRTGGSGRKARKLRERSLVVALVVYISEIKRCDLYHDIMHICFNYIDILIILRGDTT